MRKVPYHVCLMSSSPLNPKFVANFSRVSKFPKKSKKPFGRPGPDGDDPGLGKLGAPGPGRPGNPGPEDGPGPN